MNATVILSAIMAATTSVSPLSNFAYDNEVNNGKVESQTVYEIQNQKYLHPHLKYDFQYDSQNRLTQKEVLKWNEQVQKYEKEYCLNIRYSNNETSIEYASWNKQTQAYSEIKEKAVYRENEKGVLANYQNYEWNKSQKDWNLVVDHLTINWTEALLATK